MKPPKIYIILLNWNNYDDSKKCIESVLKSSYQNKEIIFVDNGSVDNSGIRLKEEFSEIQFIFNAENLGFSRGCNVGIRAALGRADCDYILLLNNDAEVTINALQRAVEMAESDKRIGLVGGKMLFSPDCKTIWYAGGHVDLWRGQVVVRGQLEKDGGQYDRIEKVDFVTGALMLIKREVLEKVGLLPEEYFFGWEEYDYSVTVKRAGYSLYYVPDFLVYHSGDGSHWNYDPKYVYLGYREKLIFVEKFLPKGLFPLWKMVFKLYCQFIFKPLRMQRINKYYPIQREKMIASLEDIKLAILAAMGDHGKDRLTENSMGQFEKRLQLLKNEALKIA